MGYRYTGQVRLRRSASLSLCERRLLRRLACLARRVAHNWEVAFRDGVGAAGLVLVDHVVHLGPEDVPGMLVHPLVVQGLAENGRPARCAATDAHAREQLEGRNNC